MPAFSLKKCCETTQELFEECKTNLGSVILTNSSFYELMPFDSENENLDNRVARVALKLKAPDLSLNLFESLLSSQKTMESQLSILRESLEAATDALLSDDFHPQTTVPLNPSPPSLSPKSNVQSKSKPKPNPKSNCDHSPSLPPSNLQPNSLENPNSNSTSLQSENTKLKQLLKSQLETSEQIRKETQRTVRTLKAEFDYLVKVCLFNDIRSSVVFQREN